MKECLRDLLLILWGYIGSALGLFLIYRGILR